MKGGKRQTKKEEKKVNMNMKLLALCSKKIKYEHKNYINLATCDLRHISILDTKYSFLHYIIMHIIFELASNNNNNYRMHIE